LDTNPYPSPKPGLRWQPWVFFGIVAVLYLQFRNPYNVPVREFLAQQKLIKSGMTTAEVDGIVRHFDDRHSSTGDYAWEGKRAVVKNTFLMVPHRTRLWIDLKYAIQVYYDKDGRVAYVHTADL